MPIELKPRHSKPWWKKEIPAPPVRLIVYPAIVAAAMYYATNGAKQAWVELNNPPARPVYSRLPGPFTDQEIAEMQRILDQSGYQRTIQVSWQSRPRTEPGFSGAQQPERREPAMPASRREFGLR